MKVLEEIVAYLHDRGALTGDEVEALERFRAFIRRRFNHDDDWGCNATWEGVDEPDLQDEAFPAVATPPPGAGGARVRAVDVKAGVLASRVNAFFREHEGPVGALARVAGFTGGRHPVGAYRLDCPRRRGRDGDRARRRDRLRRFVVPRPLVGDWPRRSPLPRRARRARPRGLGLSRPDSRPRPPGLANTSGSFAAEPLPTSTIS